MKSDGCGEVVVKVKVMGGGSGGEGEGDGWGDSWFVFTFFSCSVHCTTRPSPGAAATL
jgi:hypothetical protein